MSALTVYEGLEERLLTIDGLNAVILGEPTGIHDPPAVYVALQSMGREHANQLTAAVYTFLLRLVVRWQENAEAERELLTLANQIPAAIDADRRLAGRLMQGVAMTGDAVAGFLVIGGTTYRILDYTVTATEKGPIGGTL